MLLILLHLEKWKRSDRKPASRTDITRWLDGPDEGLEEFDCPVIVKGTAKPGGLKARTCRPSRLCWHSSRELCCPWCQTAMKWEALCYPTLRAVTNIQKYTSTNGHIQRIKLLFRHVFFHDYFVIFIANIYTGWGLIYKCPLRNMNFNFVLYFHLFFVCFNLVFQKCSKNIFFNCLVYTWHH